MTDLNTDERALLQQLLDEAAIRRVITNYTYAIDWGNIEVLETLFWPDADIALGPFTGDRAAYLPFVHGLADNYARQLHMFSGERIAVFDASADAEVGCVIVVRNKTDENFQDEFMWGRYLFRLEKRDGLWKIARLRTLPNLRELLPLKPAKPTPFDGLNPAHELFPRFRRNE